MPCAGQQQSLVCGSFTSSGTQLGQCRTDAAFPAAWQQSAARPRSELRVCQLRIGLPSAELAARVALGVESARKPDICDLGDVAVAAKQYVGGLEVQMNDAVGVQEMHPLSSTHRDVAAPATNTRSQVVRAIP